MSLIAGSGCVPGEEQSVELALREAVGNAILHGNSMDAHKLVYQRGGTEVHIRKLSGNEQETPAHSVQNRIVGRSVRRPWPGARAAELG